MTIALVTLVVTAVAAPLVVRALRRAGRLDQPNARSSHTAPTPRGGGLAVLAGLAVVAAVFGLGVGSWPAPTWWALAGCCVLAGVGFMDDTRGLGALPRLVAQVGVGVVCGFALGGVPGAVLGLVVVPAAVNMVNFMDGINGLCAAHAAVWGAAALLASQHGGGAALALLGGVSLGGGLGFLPYNVPRAKLFLGDVGSYLIGGLAGLGILAALGATRTTGAEIGLVLTMVCAPYLLFAVDTATTIVRRARAGEPLLDAHRSHIYQRLTNEGGRAHWQVSLAMAAVSLMAALAFLLGPVVGLTVSAIAAAGYLATPRLLLQQAVA